MKVAAHPMLVAVALGLLGPGALAADNDEPEAVRAPAPAAADLDGVAEALDDESAPYWARLSLVGNDEAAAWREDPDLTL